MDFRNRHLISQLKGAHRGRLRNSRRASFRVYRLFHGINCERLNGPQIAKAAGFASKGTVTHYVHAAETYIRLAARVIEPSPNAKGPQPLQIVGLASVASRKKARTVGKSDAEQISIGFRKLPHSERAKFTPTEWSEQCFTPAGTPDPRLARSNLCTAALKEAKRLATLRASDLSAKPWRKRFIHADASDFMEKMKEAGTTYSLIHADPPYPGYSHTSDGTYKEPGCKASYRGIRDDVANQDQTLVTEILQRIIATLPDTLAPQGVCAIWHRGGSALPFPVVEAVHNAGLEALWILEYDKKRAQTGDNRDRHTYSTESLHIIGRPDEDHHLVTDHKLWRGTIFNLDHLVETREAFETDSTRPFYEPDQHAFDHGYPMPACHANGALQTGRVQVGDLHFMQKYCAHALYLLMRHAQVGSRVIDLFSCSCSFAIAAAQYGADHYAVELHEENYEWGLTRFADYLAAVHDQQQNTEVA